MSADSARAGEPRFVEVAGRRIRHRVAGDGGDAVLLVHGFGGSLESWDANQAVLAAGGRRVAALDLPGHGESSTDVGTGSLDELVAVVLGYMDVTGIRRAHFVGHSMGAAIGLALTDDEPARVRSLALVGPAGIGRRIDADFIHGIVAARTRDELEPKLRMLYADPGWVTPEMVQRFVAWKQRSGVIEALTRIASTRYPGTPSGRALREVAGSVPTLMVWGADDAVIPAPAPGELSLAGVRLEVLPHAGHMVQVEAASEVNRLLETFLGGLSR
jgi:pyruvate dehydrogenase E2 component (dihydrolipoamide acetyltransferase)